MKERRRMSGRERKRRGIGLNTSAAYAMVMDHPGGLCLHINGHRVAGPDLGPGETAKMVAQWLISPDALKRALRKRIRVPDEGLELR